MAETEPAEDAADEHWQVHVYAPEKEYRTYASVEVDPPEDEHVATRWGDTRQLVLTEGGDLANEELSPDRPFTTQMDTEHNLNRTVVYDAGVGVGYFAHLLETHGLPEEHTYEQFVVLADEGGLPLDAYFDFDSSLNERQRRLRLLDLLDYRVEEAGDWAAAPYRESASWRSTDLDWSGERLARQISQEIDPNPKQCYRNAQEAAIKHADNHRVQYVEGIALPKQGAQVVRHAWIEIDGAVAEITWPWHEYDGYEAVYFGVEYPADEVEDVFERRNGGSQVALSDEEQREVQRLRAGEDL